MMRGVLIFIIVLNFALGIGFGSLLQGLFEREQPLDLISGNSAAERLSPYNHVSERQITVEGDKVVISLEGEQVGWSRYTDSNSMDQTLDEGHNGIEITPKTPSQIHPGDIVAFRYDGNLVVHRVVEVGTDEAGWYARTKGDNNRQADPSKRRFEDIERLTVGIIF